MEELKSNLRLDGVVFVIVFVSLQYYGNLWLNPNVLIAPCYAQINYFMM